MKLGYWAIVAALGLCDRAREVFALPQAGTIPPSPTGASCTFHQDHWDCTSQCTTTTSYLGIATSISDYDSFISSMNAVYSTGGSFSGSEVPVYTNAFTFPGLGLITAYGYYDSDALTSAGYSIISGVTTITAPCEETPTLPPSPTGSLCSPHGDHWHCEPTPPITSSPGECEPHGDHWHCPPGVPEPTSPPNEPPTESESSSVG
ncbi:hypothetical protein AJ80_02559, partial [Polytolypa hystricis UAMH7299]